MTTLPDLLAAVTQDSPRKAAIVEKSGELSYLSLRQRVRALAGRLAAMGVERGDPVALLLPNGAEFVTSFFAVAELGGIVVPLNTHYEPNELTRFIGDCRASVLITLEEFEEKGLRALAGLTDPCHLLALDALEPAHHAPQDDKGAASSPSDGARADEVVIYQYSSGSTGQPKLIARTHANLVFELNRLAKCLALSDEDRFLGVAPFSHVNGLVRTMLASVSVGATLFPFRDFKRQQVATTIEQRRITVFIGVPFMFSILGETDFRRPVDFSSLRLCISASAPMPIAANSRFREKYGLYVRQLYGSTETGTISVNTGGEIESSLESVGVPLDGVEVAVFGDDGTAAKEDEVGEVAVKSPAAITGYHGPTGEAEPFRDGYFFTGDLGRVDRHGNLYLVGRKKFFINKGGYKINPWEIETLLERHPCVKEAVVIGVPTSYGDERVKAVIIPLADCSESEIIEHCRGEIADFKVPSVIEFRQSLPKSPTGKNLRNKLQ